MWWNKKAVRNDPVAVVNGPVSIEHDAVTHGQSLGAESRDHRNAFILLGLGGAVLVLLGIAGLGSIVAPVFLAVVLTICMHPLRIWLERHYVPRGIATGAVIVAAIQLLAGFGSRCLSLSASSARCSRNSRTRSPRSVKTWSRG